MTIEPIAVVGRGCVLPGALDPDTFYAGIAAGTVNLTPVPEGRWRVPRDQKDQVVGTDSDHVCSDRGGYVEGFDSAFDPSSYLTDVDTVRRMDTLTQWVLYAAGAALAEAGHEGYATRSGLVMGNLSFPSAAMAGFAERIWLQENDPALVERLDPVLFPRRDGGDRFCSGRPAHLAARALGLGAGGFALDAACASSLYALKQACDRLTDHRADLMVAGAVNCADDLCIHLGFTALEAMSPTGRSRPFDRGADGLVPSEGAVFVALMRLSDALTGGHEVFGVIRGIGLSNDGRSGGLLTPSSDGQERAIRLAYQAAGVAPETVSLVECHATGTPVGDAVETASMARVFGDHHDLPIGSAKSNVGHLITAAGAAGLLKVMGAMAAGVRPATVGVDTPIAMPAGAPLRVLTRAEEWSGPRRAAVSAFGFGGNNAHLVVDAWDVGSAAVAAPMPAQPAASSAPVAIVALAARVGDGRDTEDFTAALFGGPPRSGPASGIHVALSGLHFPPKDLEQTLAQQLLALETVRDAVAGMQLPRERTMVLMGMGADPEVARYGARRRAIAWEREFGRDNSAGVEDWCDAFADPLNAAGVLGTMPNVVANRISTQLDLAGPSFTVSSEEASGTVGLALATRALRAGEIDAAVVGAVDLSHEPVHRAALAELGADSAVGDAAVALVLRRLADARSNSESVIAIIDESDTSRPSLVVGPESATTATDGAVRFDPAQLFGTPHAAAGLLAVASAAMALQHRAVPKRNAVPDMWLDTPTAEVVVPALDAATTGIRLRAGDEAPWVREPLPRPHVYSGHHRAEVLAALAEDRQSNTGPSRLVVLASGPDEFARRAAAARAWLSDAAPQPEDVFFRTTPITGETAFVFTSGSMAYGGMGREIGLAFPDVLRTLEHRHGSVREIDGRSHTGERPGRQKVLEQIFGACMLGQIHSEITRGVLGITPTAVLGYSSGETAAMSTMGVWTDIAALTRDVRAASLFDTDVVGEMTAIRRWWAREGIDGTRWSSWLVAAPADQVLRVLRDEPAVHLMIVNAPHSCVVGGEAQACRRVLDRLSDCLAFPIDYDMAVHAPEAQEVRDAWRALHHRPTAAPPGIRFYSGATTESYYPTADSVADAVTDQAMRTVDFAGTVTRAFDDGVRVFIEHGPRGLCTGWIRETLAGRDHLAVALDDTDGRNLRQLVRSVGELMAAGIPMQTDRLFNQLPAPRSDPGTTGHYLTFPAHPAPVHLPEQTPTAEIMAPAPALPPAPAAPVRAAVNSAQAPTPAEPGATTPTPTSRQLLSQAHQNYLTLAAQTHEQYLAGRHRARQQLRQRRNGRAATRPLPTVPADDAADGPAFDRTQLEHLASGRISEVFGPEFAGQDGFTHQTRLPMPPMLLVDRVTRIDAVPRSMGTGRIRTETDVASDSWYLDSAGRMPAGIMVEAGQADLLLISWLGVDLLHSGDRVYRLLGCDLTYHGSPAEPGETLRYDIRIDGHSEHNGIRLFFFRYDCFVGDELRMSVRNGQAGFFTAAELARTGGVLWDATDETAPDGSPPDPPILATRRQFGPDELRAFVDGRPADCFGPGWVRARPHVRSPRLGNGRMQLLTRVSDFDPTGGPWRWGYLCAQADVAPDDWYFEGHFLNDPCMPGTLILDGCLQAMSFYLAALGTTVERDGWRFEPVPDRCFELRCRGQVTPRRATLTYELFVAEVSLGPLPTLIADVLVTVDGVKAFHGHRVGLRLVPDWPLAYWRRLGPHTEACTGTDIDPRTLGGLVGYRDSSEPAEVDGFRFGYASLLACAWGKPSDAFGSCSAVFDGIRRTARLPGPPYHFMTRVSAVGGPPGGIKTGSWVEVDYDVPDQVWYWEQNDYPVMPFGVLMEVALQPCGWLACYVGSPLTTDTDLMFRNLDGTGVVTGAVTPSTGTVRTRTTLTTISRIDDVIIESFDVEVHADGRTIFSLNTVFGFFPVQAFENQVGLTPTDAERRELVRPCDRIVDLTGADRYGTGLLRLPGSMLLMLDRVTGYWPAAGAAGLGRLRAEKNVNPDEWFFSAHFFQDPVQPGSLGIQAMCQLLQFYLIERGAAERYRAPCFAPVLTEREVSWKYRGQVVPTNGRITIEMEILEYERDTVGEYAVAQAWLWVDDKRIYHAPTLGMQVVDETSDMPLAPVCEHVVDPTVDRWVNDHRPTWTVPTLPMMSVVDQLAGFVATTSGQAVVALRDVTIGRWLPVARPLRLTARITPVDDGWQATLLAWRDAKTANLSQFEAVASVTAHAHVLTPRPPMFTPPADAELCDNPYSSGVLFHGPAFQYLTEWRVGSTGSSGVVDVGAGSVPRGTLHQGLLDAAIQIVPHDSLWRWHDRITRSTIGYPICIRTLDVFEPLPDRGQLVVEARFAGFDGDPSRPMFDVQICRADRVLVALRLIDILIPVGLLGQLNPKDRMRFVRDRRYVPGYTISTTDGDTTRLSAGTLELYDWLPGTVASLYNLPDGARGRDHLEAIAARDHIADLACVHPSAVNLADDCSSATVPGNPTRYHLGITRSGDEVIVRTAPQPHHDG